MTYSELLAKLEELIKADPAVGGQTVTVYDASSDEYYASSEIVITPDCDVLDRGHPYIVFK